MATLAEPEGAGAEDDDLARRAAADGARWRGRRPRRGRPSPRPRRATSSGTGMEHRVVGGHQLGPGARRAGDHADVDPGADVTLGERPAQVDVSGPARRAERRDAPGGAAQPRVEHHPLADLEAPGLGTQSSTTSATTSCPGTWGREEKAAIGLSMSPSCEVARGPAWRRTRRRPTGSDGSPPSRGGWAGRRPSGGGRRAAPPAAPRARRWAPAGARRGRDGPRRRGPSRPRRVRRPAGVGRRVGHRPHGGHEPVEVLRLHLDHGPQVGNVVLEPVAGDAVDDAGRHLLGRRPAAP